MRILLLKLVFTYLLFIIPTVTSQSQTIDSTKEKSTLMVGVAGSEPFVFEEKGKGIAVEIWQKIAAEKSWQCDYVHFSTVEEALNALENNELDLVVGPISITSSRIGTMRFSQPFYNSSISIISKKMELSFWQKIEPLFSIKLLIAVVIFLVILSIVGMLLWLAERKQSPEQFPQDPLKGIGTGMWLAIVTMSTTGYGDKAPITLKGRIIAGSWMVVSIIFATSMVAGIASTLAISSLGSQTLSTIEQLSGRKVATISDSPSESFLIESKVDVIGVNNIDEAIDKLKNDEVEAVVYDRPQLLYVLKNNEKSNFYISKAEYYKQGYGFAFPHDSPLVLDVNRTLLRLDETHNTERIINYYIKKDE